MDRVGLAIMQTWKKSVDEYETWAQNYRRDGNME